MINNRLRWGNFTSSQISALMSTGKQVDGFGVAAITYIQEKNMERMLGRSLDTEVNSKPTSWGKCLENRVFDLLGLEYTLTSQETDVHPEISTWSGSKDGTREGAERAVIDIKAPISIKSFVQLVLPLYHGFEGIDAMMAIANGYEYNGLKYPAHKMGYDYYIQLVSNACINGTDYAELIVYMPYESELLAIKQLADGNPNMYWMNYAQENEIPCLPDNGTFKNLNTIRFKVPQSDKDLLTENVIKASKYLIPDVLLATYDSKDKVTVIERV